MHSLANKNALVLGGTSGIGQTVATSFGQAGARVVIAGRRDASVDASAMGAEFLRCDMTSEQEVVDTLDITVSKYGLLDVLVINAGMADDEGSIESYSSESMKAVMDVNFNGAFYAFKHAPNRLKDGASVIYTGSVAGSGVTHAGAAVYAASKAGGAYLMRASAIENAPRGIRVNAVCPALIADTGMMVADDGNETAAFLSQLNAFGRMGRQDEITGIYNFLASDASTFITGQEIRVDGGMTAGIGLPTFAAIGG